MSDINRYVCTGRLTRDPQVKYAASGSAICDFGLAIGSQWTDKATGQRKEEVTFVDVTAFGRTGELIGQHFAKGKQIALEGRLKLDQWDDKQTGQKRSKLRVTLDNFTFVGTRDPESQEPRVPQEDAVDPPSTQGIGDAEVPF